MKSTQTKPKTARRKGADDAAPYLFHEGTNFHSDEYLGAHRRCDGTLVTRVWAPNAKAVSVVSECFGWDTGFPMNRITENGIWEAILPADTLSDGDLYKYRIETKNGRSVYKADPFGLYMERPPETATVLWDAPPYRWRDAGWMKFRAETMANGGFYRQPMNIYEIHLGSWRHHEDGSPYTYTDLARELPPYVKQMGYTHVEMMPVMEHPFAGSWGYQICGYFAPSSRFGTPDDFRALVDSLHEAGIGVILDWVPAHFPKDAHGLYEFDGQPLYEYQGADRMEHRDWGTRCFDVGRQEVQSFLISNAVFWIEKYHADGLRVDAVSSMLYLDYGREPGEWFPNMYGDNRCLEAIAFFRKLNDYIRHTHPDVLMIAEESTAYPNITSFDGDGLGFDLKWNMGWMNDTLFYAALDPYFRKYNHNKTTFSLTYAFSEKYVLPISHDEVVHGKKSFLDKCPGDYGQKFAGERVTYAWQMTHPGKKLSFMGSEIGQFREWDYEGQIEWFLLDYNAHAEMQKYVAALNHFYLEHPALWERDSGWDGFTWIDADNADDSILTFRRRARSREDDREPSELVVILNMTPVRRDGFRLGVPAAGTWREVFNSDDIEFGGSGLIHKKPIKTEHVLCNYLQESIVLDVPGLSAIILELDTRPKPAGKKTTAGKSPAPKTAASAKEPAKKATRSKKTTGATPKK